METPGELAGIPAAPAPPSAPSAPSPPADGTPAAAPAAGIDEVVGAALADVLDPSDHLVLASDAMVRESLHLFEKCKVALSEQRLFVLRLGRGEQRWHLSYPRSRCSIIKMKKRFDGSRLVIVGHGNGVTGLYFGRGHAAQAEAIFDGMPMASENAVVDAADSPD
jgi:hypothetical protein